jgi:MinD-like ATPase involved in chromosome partitioning or flagellar assembly
MAWTEWAQRLVMSASAREVAELPAMLAADMARCRRISVLAGAPGDGASTVSSLLGLSLSRRPDRRVLLVDAAGGTRHPALHHLLGVRPRRTLAELTDPVRPVSTWLDISSALTPVRNQLWLLPTDPNLGRQHPDADLLARAVLPVEQFFDIVVMDVGARPGPGVASWSVSRTHAHCLVLAADADGLGSAHAYLRTTRRRSRPPDGAATWTDHLLLVANQATQRRPPSWHDRRRLARLHHDGMPTVELAADPGLTAERRRSLRPASQLAGLRMAAELTKLLTTNDQAGADPTRDHRQPAHRRLQGAPR